MATEDTEMVPGLSTSVTIGLAVVTATTFVYFIYSKFLCDDWSKYGVKTGKMGFGPFSEEFTKLINKHGDTVGLNRSPLLLVTRNLDLLRQIMVKDFNNFTDRMSFFFSKSALTKGVFFLEGQDWKRVRGIVSPSFSSAKLKVMSKTVEDTARKLTNLLEDCARKNKLVPIKHMTGQYTSEIIARTAFGFQTNCQGGEDDEFTYYCKNFLKIRSRIMNILLILLLRFKRLNIFLIKTLKIEFFDGINKAADTYFRSLLQDSVADRKAYETSRQANSPNDLFHSLIAARDAGDKLANASSNISEDFSEELSVPSVKTSKTLSDEELIGQSMIIILAGFETTATTLQMILYLIAKHPDVQEKVYEEIKAVVSSETPTHEELAKLMYMEQVINETLRLYPPAPQMSRKAADTVTYGDITIPKGAGIMIPIFLVLKDPKHWPDPETFDPERFSEENKAKRDPMAFLAFGSGPRLCLGMRLAYLELKVALVHILRKIKVELNEQTLPKRGEELEMRFAGILIIEKPIQLAVKLRNEE